MSYPFNAMAYRRFAAMICLGLLPHAFLQAASLGTPNWDRDLALEVAQATPVENEVNEVVTLMVQDSYLSALERLKTMAERSDWAAPATDRAMYQAARALSDVPEGSVSPGVVEFLSTYQPRTMVAHEESTEIGVPLYPVRATVAGAQSRWRTEAAADEVQALIATDHGALLARYAANEDPAWRRGANRVLASASHEQLKGLVQAGLPLIAEFPGLAGLLGNGALASGDAAAFAAVVSHGSGAEMVDLLRRAGTVFSAAELEAIEHESAGVAAPETAAVMRAVFASGASTNPIPLADGGIESWTEEDGVLGLGYPVPIPVDTPMPFDGFRTYNGLHSRHQQLMNDTDVIHGEVVGMTHNGNEVWAYRIGDADRETWEGMPEAATLTNGGIHAREWQTPEVVTGIMELFAERQGDHHYYDFLLENVNMIVVPVHNVDGFMQTQRYPSQNYLGTDPNDEGNPTPFSPRDGRMRRKNMPGVDTALDTEADHLLGIDLNRNNPPLWATDPTRSSDDVRSLVYHGASGHSEPESQALLAAADLGPADQLRLFNDVHSFSQVFYFHRTQNIGLNSHVVSLLFNQSNFNATLPGGALYLFNPDPTINIDAGFGMTNEYFTTQLEIPAYGIEVEPNQGGPNFPGSPGCGANYGGLARNCHDGFILPESEIRRVRENMAQSISANFYQQAGPPAISAVRIVDVATGAVVYEAEWDMVSATERALYTNQVMPIQLDREYTYWLAYDRPMRWREDGVVTSFPGQPRSTLNLDGGIFVDGMQLTNNLENLRWIDMPGGAPNGYFRYQDDVFATEFVLPSDENNLALVSTTTLANIRNTTTNMTGQALDADPSTPITWSGGGWKGWEDDDGAEAETGGTDASYFMEITDEVLPDPFVVEPNTSAAWFDLAHDGEGFMIEILEGDRAVMYWFTYDEDGEQAWYIAVGKVVGNRLVFDEVLRTSGGVFGPGFDPATVETTVAGSATFLYEGCDTGTMVYQIDGRKGRFDLQRLSSLLGVDCGGDSGAVPAEATRSGSWYSASQDGHGFVIEILDNGQVLVYWFTYDLEGNQAWFFGVGTVDGDSLTLDEVFATRGPKFGPDFDPNDLELIDWGTLEFNLGCDGGGVTYKATLFGFPAVSLPLTRLSVLAGLSCDP